MTMFSPETNPRKVQNKAKLTGSSHQKANTEIRKTSPKTGISQEKKVILSIQDSAASSMLPKAIWILCALKTATQANKMPIPQSAKPKDKLLCGSPGAFLALQQERWSLVKV